MSRRGVQLLVLIIECAMPLVTASTSHAGLYQVSACTEPVGYVNNSWTVFTNSSVYIETHSACNQEPTHEQSAGLSNLAVADVMETEDPPVGAEAGWSFTAPLGTTISEVTGLDDLYKIANNNWQVYVEDAGGNVLAGQTCHVDLGNGPGCETSGLFQAAGLSTLSVTVGMRCTENSFHNCPDGATIHDVRAELDYATVTIKDELAPTSVTGSQIPTGSQHGTIAILGSATDDAAGVLSLSIVNSAGEVVGGPVAPSTPCDYSFATPCPQEVSDLSIPIDTTKLPNGQDQIRVEATNAAHDEGFSVPYTIDVENSSPKQGVGGGSPEGGSQTGSSGGSKPQVGGSGTSSGQVPSEGSTTLTGASSTTTPTAVSIHLDKVRRDATNLLISGHLEPALAGTLVVTIWHTGSRRVVIRGLRLRVTNGRFHARIALARRLRRRHLTVGIGYPGAVGYRGASLTQVVGPTSALLR